MAIFSDTETKMMRRILLLAVLVLSACTQEIQAGVPLPAVTEIVIPPTKTQVVQIPPTETAVPLPSPTSTPITFPPPASLPAGPISMIAIGDSLTKGDGDETARGYPGRLLEMVNEQRPNSTLTNFGQSGWTSSALIAGGQGMFGQLPRAVAEVESARAQERGAVVFVWIGNDDLWDLYEHGGDVDDAQEQQDLQRFASNLDTILIELRQVDAQVIIALLDDPSKRPAVSSGSALPSTTPEELERMSVQVQQYNSLIVQKAARYGALTVDFSSTDIFTKPVTLSADGIHPNRTGYDLVAQAWYEVLLTLID